MNVVGQSSGTKSVGAASPCADGFGTHWAIDLYCASSEQCTNIGRDLISQVLSYLFMQTLLTYRFHKVGLAAQVSMPYIEFKLFKVNGGDCVALVQVCTRTGAILTDGNVTGCAVKHESVQDAILRALYAWEDASRTSV